MAKEYNFTHNRAAYIHLCIRIQHGEFEYYADSAHALDVPRNVRDLTEGDIRAWAAEYARTYYSAEPERIDNVNYFFAGTVATSVHEVTRITKKEYEVLHKYL